MSPETVFFIGLIPSFLAGFLIGSIYEKGKTVTQHAPSRIFDWFSRDNRLVGLVVVTALLAGIAVLYTFTSNAGNESRDKHNLDCLTAFVQESTQASKPRAKAAFRMQSALKDWIRGASVEEPGLTKEELRLRYLLAASAYAVAQDDNPAPPNIRQYCEGLSK